MNEPETTTRAGPAPALRTHCLALRTPLTIVRTATWSGVLLGWSNVLVGAMRASGAALVPALLSMAAIVGVERPVAVAREARFGLAGVF